MRVERFSIPGPVLFYPKLWGDSRGFFLESFKASVFEKEGVPREFLQDNHSRSARAVVRGLHLQAPPHEQGKLVRVTKGKAFDVAVDIRKGSSTYGKWVGVLLTEEEQNIFWVPPGFAHGFSVLEDGTDFLYKVTKEYSVAHEMGIRFDDPDLNIDWKIEKGKELVAEKDRKMPFLKDFQSPFVF